MKTTLKQFGKHILFGIIIILGGLFLYMTITISIGYLPYSDRPGPGWYDKDFGITWDEINSILGFISFLGIYIIGTLILAYLLFRLFRLIGYNQVIYSILGGFVIGISTLYWTLGIGWYIALDGSTAITGGILGLIYGSTLFPKYLRPTK